MTKNRMTAHQQTAYQSPCFEAEETTQRKFYWQAQFGGILFSVGMTANIGLE